MTTKRGKTNSFWRILVKFEDKILQIHKHSWLSITWRLKKSNSIQILVEDISSLSQTFSTAPFEQNPYKFFLKAQNLKLFDLKLFLSWPADVMIRTITDSILESTHSLHFQNKTISGSLCTAEQKATMFLPPLEEVILK